jgi:hypothetical protein
MDRLSLALTLLGWVLIALLSFFVGVISITRIETRYSIDAMDTAERQIIRAGAAVTGECHAGSGQRFDQMRAASPLRNSP